MDSVFTYICTNENCKQYGKKLNVRQVGLDRKCRSCKHPTSDYMLYDGDPTCKHEEIKGNWSGIKCKKCRGWFCY